MKKGLKKGQSIADKIVVALTQRSDADIDRPVKDTDIAAAVKGKLAHVQNVLGRLVKKHEVTRTSPRFYVARLVPVPGPMTAGSNRGEGPSDITATVGVGRIAELVGTTTEGRTMAEIVGDIAARIAHIRDGEEEAVEERDALRAENERVRIELNRANQAKGAYQEENDALRRVMSIIGNAIELVPEE